MSSPSLAHLLAAFRGISLAQAEEEVRLRETEEKLADPRRPVVFLVEPANVPVFKVADKSDDES